MKMDKLKVTNEILTQLTDRKTRTCQQPGGLPFTLYTLFLPLNHNNGCPVQPERLTWALREILRRSPGLTQFPVGQGLWIDQAANLYRDLIVPIQVALPLEQEGTEVWFANLASELAVVLEQHQIFLFAQTISMIEAATLPSPDDIRQAIEGA
jgi:hypothetical protein